MCVLMANCSQLCRDYVALPRHYNLRGGTDGSIPQSDVRDVSTQLLVDLTDGGKVGSAVQSDGSLPVVLTDIIVDIGYLSAVVCSLSQA